MKNLIPSKDNSIEPNGAIGLQKCGIIFWQKTGFFSRCSLRRFQSVVHSIEKNFSPDLVRLDDSGTSAFIRFGNDDRKMIFLTVNRDAKTNRRFIYGESHTVYADPEFHIFALEIASFAAKCTGSKFYVDDATHYLSHNSPEQLRQYFARYRKKHPSYFDNT